MYKKAIYTLRSNERLTPAVWRMTLEGDTQWITAPGQFVNVELDGCYLRRPISVCDWDERTITLIYKVVGEGTALMAGLRPGARLDLLTGLGNGFDVTKGSRRELLVGGGVGVPPLYNLAKRLLADGREVAVVLGFNTAAEVFFRDEFAQLGCRVVVATADGTEGVRGFVTDAIRESGLTYDYFYACGPLPMLRALSDATKCSGQLSFEERMGCGFGACMGCSCKTKYGNKRICKEGPVLTKEEVIWNENDCARPVGYAERLAAGQSGHSGQRYVRIRQRIPRFLRHQHSGHLLVQGYDARRALR